MDNLLFDGQQAGERVLYVILPHPLGKYIAIIRIILLAVFFATILFLIGSVVPDFGSLFGLIAIILALSMIAIGTWWNNTVYTKDKTFITDRRIIRFDQVSPFFQSKRALFWNEALKAKAFSPNLFYRAFKVGNIVVEPILAEGENVRVSDVYYFDDLANYIDKILFTFKNQPDEISALAPFVPKPRGLRG